jgi:hypothetical protein
MGEMIRVFALNLQTPSGAAPPKSEYHSLSQLQIVSNFTKYNFLSYILIAAA